MDDFFKLFQADNDVTINNAVYLSGPFSLMIAFKTSLLR